MGYDAACEVTRMWLNIAPPACDLRAVGLDRSEPAIRFATDAGLLDGGIARDFEQPDASPTDDECAWFRSCNLMISTGAIGYVTARTLDVVLRQLGRNYPGHFGPLAVVTILRMFDSSPIRAAFERHGLTLGRVQGVRLPQRRFADEEEQRCVLSLLHDRGIDTREWEDRGKHYADLYVAAPPRQYSLLQERMMETALKCGSTIEANGYIHR